MAGQVQAGLAQRFKKWERALQARYKTDLSTPRNRRRAMIYHLFLDHGLLRHWWTNMAQVAPGVWRSNHPLPGRLPRLHRMGIRTILSLRGALTSPNYLLEKEGCDALGIALHSVSLAARRAPAPAELLSLINLFRELPRPFLMHCKSGADRAGLASAIYLIVIEGQSVPQARKHLSPRFLHFRRSSTGILDHVLDLYEARLTDGPVTMERWIAEEYDPEAATRSFAAGR